MLSGSLDFWALQPFERFYFEQTLAEAMAKSETTPGSSEHTVSPRESTL
jgi:hypothetical protein